MFNENSGLVKVWVDLIRSGKYELTDVPTIGNLYEVVEKILTDMEAKI